MEIRTSLTRLGPHVMESVHRSMPCCFMTQIRKLVDQLIGPEAAHAHPRRLRIRASFFPDIDAARGDGSALLGVQSTRDHSENPYVNCMEYEVSVSWCPDPQANASWLHHGGGRELEGEIKGEG